MKDVACIIIDSSLSPASPLGYCCYAYQAFAPVVLNMKFSNVSAGSVIIEASIRGNLYYYRQRAASSKKQPIHINKPHAKNSKGTERGHKRSAKSVAAGTNIQSSTQFRHFSSWIFGFEEAKNLTLLCRHTATTF